MKSKRQAMILEIIESQPIRKQDELAEALRSRGLDVTQATVSRDIKEMHLTKILMDDGSYRYSAIEREEAEVGNRLIRMFSNSVLDMNWANNLLVIHTITGSAHVAGEALDNLHWPEILGTIAGDNTILVVIRSNNEVESVVHRLRGVVEEK